MRPGIAIAAAKTQFIVKEQEIRQPYNLPAPKQTTGKLSILFSALWFEIDTMADKIDYIERIKLTISFDVP